MEIDVVDLVVDVVVFVVVAVGLADVVIVLPPGRFPVGESND